MTELQPEIILVKRRQRLNRCAKHLIVGSLAVISANKLNSCLNVLIRTALQQCIVLINALIIKQSQRHTCVLEPCCHKPCYRDRGIGPHNYEPALCICHFIKVFLPEITGASAENIVKLNSRSYYLAVAKSRKQLCKLLLNLTSCKALIKKQISCSLGSYQIVAFHSIFLSYTLTH